MTDEQLRRIIEALIGLQNTVRLAVIWLGLLLVVLMVAVLFRS